MSPELNAEQVQVFRFSVPDLPEVVWALAQREVLEVTTLSTIRQIPFTPPFMYGMALWRDNPVAVVDLAAACRTPTNGLTPHYRQLRCLIGQTVIEEQVTPVAWPVLSGSGLLKLPAQIRQSRPPDAIPAELVRANFSLLSLPVTLLDLAGLMKLAAL